MERRKTLDQPTSFDFFLDQEKEIFQEINLPKAPLNTVFQCNSYIF